MDIPVIGVPVVNSTFWVTRLIASIDYPVDNLVIINNNGRGELDEELDNLVKMTHPNINKMKVVHMPANIGVAGAWNLIIKCYMYAKYWVIVNDDISFKHGCLKSIAEAFDNDPELNMIHPEPGEWNIGTWDCFAISDDTVNRFGLFDENTYPAYCEDADYIMRMVHYPTKKIIGLDNSFIHGYNEPIGYYEEGGGSNTGKADPQLGAILTKANDLNIDYLTEKWGEGWRKVDPRHLPFLDRDPHIGTTSYDLNFVRRKYTGF